MVRHPGDYRWSSYADNAGIKNSIMLQAHSIYQQLGRNPAYRHYAYRELCNQNLEKTELHIVREALNQELVLGGDDFKDKIEKMTKRQTRPGIPGRPCVKEPGAIYDGFLLY